MQVHSVLSVIIIRTMRKIFITLFISFLLFGCLRAKKSPFDLNSGSGVFGSIGISTALGINTIGKEITSFSLITPSVSGTIVDTNISVSVPVGTNLTNLIAEFTTTGQSVKIGSTTQTSGVTTNDFTNPVVYTVLASDNTTKDYTITVTESGQVSSPSFNIPTGTYNADLAITISTTTVGALIYFNRSTGSAPTDPDCTGVGTLYSGPITVDSTGTIIKAIACKSGLAASPIITATYTLKVAATYPESNNTENKLVTPYTFTGTTTSVIAVTKCLSTATPSCNTDGTCNTGNSNLAYNSAVETVTVSAIGCRANYLPSDVQSKTYTRVAHRSSDNVYLIIVDSTAGTSLNKKVYICSEGETYNATTNTCEGVPSTAQFCTSDSDACNGGSPTGILTNVSPAFNACKNKTDGGLNTWRVPALNELRDFYYTFIKNPTGWPTTAVTGGLWSNQSLNSSYGNSVSNTGMYQVNIDNTQKTSTKNIRCFSD